MVRHGPVTNHAEFGFDPLHIFHQDREHFLSPFIEKLFLHFVENDGWIGRFIPCRFIPPNESVIAPTLVRITDDFIGRIDLTDLGFGVSAIGIAVRMVLKDQLPVGLLDRVIGRVARDPQHPVKVDSCHGGDYTMHLSALHLDTHGQAP